MAQVIRITGPKSAGTLTGTPVVFNTLAAPSPNPGTVTFTETAVLGIFDSSDLGGIVAGWYQFVDAFDVAWWALVAASGTVNAQKSPPDATVGTVTNRVTANADQIAGNATAATNLAASAETMLTGAVVTTGFTPTTTEFESDITEAHGNQFVGRIVVFRPAATTIKRQASPVTAYSLVSGRGHFTVTALTQAPASGDTFIIV